MGGSGGGREGRFGGGGEAAEGKLKVRCGVTKLHYGQGLEFSCTSQKTCEVLVESKPPDHSSVAPRGPRLKVLKF